MTDAAAITLYADGSPLDLTAVSLTGFRLHRTLDHPAELSLRFALATPDQAMPLDGAQDLTLSDGAVDLFQGRMTRLTRALGPHGMVADVTATDQLAALARQWTASTAEITSLRRFLANAAQRCGLHFETAGWSDFAVGRHLNLAETDLDHTAALAGRFGIGLSSRPGALVAVDLTDPPAEAAHVLDPPAVTELTESRTPPHARPDPVWQGWSADDDRTFGTGGRGAPALGGQPVRAAEPTARIAAARRAHALARSDTLTGELTGLAEMWPGETVTGPTKFTAQLILTQVELLLDAAGGARTRISTLPLDVPEPAPQPVFATGTIDRTDDPAAAGRVRVALNGHTAATTGWLPVTGQHSRTAGGTGLAVPLQPGDPVLIAAPGGDPDLGIVLGGLLRAGGPGSADAGQGWQTWQGDGAAIRLDNGKNAIRMALDAGAQVEMQGGDITLTAPGDFKLNCSGNVVISGSRIDFEKAS